MDKSTYNFIDNPTNSTSSEVCFDQTIRWKFNGLT